MKKLFLILCLGIFLVSLVSASSFGNGGDGAVIFTTGTKSYGNLVLNTDYKVSGNTLYLKVDRLFNFTNFTLGSGTVLAPYNPNTKGAVIYIQANDTTTINGTVQSNFASAYNPAFGTVVSSTFSSPTGSISTPSTSLYGGAGGNAIFGVSYFECNYLTGGTWGSNTPKNGYGAGGGGGASCSIFGGYAKGGNGGDSGVGIIGGTGGATLNPSSFEAFSNDGGNATNSGGGGGGNFVYEYGTSTGGNGGGVYSGAGSFGSASAGTETYGHAGAGGGGGAGGAPGYPGLNFYLTSKKIEYHGIINTSGTNGANGGNGADGVVSYGSSICTGSYDVIADGGAGGGGGAGGSSGNIVFRYSEISNSSSTNILNKGLGGIGGSPGLSYNCATSSSTVEAGYGGSDGNQGSFITHFIDETPPIVNLISPTNNSNLTSNLVSFNVTQSDLGELKNSTLYLWDNSGNLYSNANSTIISGISNSTQWDFSFPDGTYLWNSYTCDASNNCGFNSTNFTFTVDETPPTIDSSSPIDFYSSDTFLVNFNSSFSDESNLANTTLKIWNLAGNLINSNSTTLENTSDSATFQYTFTQDGTYLWNSYTCDIFGNCGFDTNKTIYISTTNPSINLLNPTNNQYLNNSSTLLNFTASNSNGINTCQLWSNFTGSWALNQTFNQNGAISSSNSTTKILSDNSYLWNVWCNTTVGGKNSFAGANFTFVVDTVKPQVSINSITTTKGSQTFSFNTTATDINLDSCFYSVYNSTGGIDLATTSNKTFTCNSNPQSSTVSDYGNYTLYVYASDYSGNLNLASYNFTTSSSSGNVTIISGGGGGTIIIGIGNWTMETTPNQKSYDLNIPKGTSRKLSVRFKNTGESNRTITLSCQDINGTMCQYVTFENKTFSLPLIKDLVTEKTFFISLPKDVPPQTSIFNIIGTDDEDSKKSISVTVSTANQNFFFEILTKLSLSTSGGIPYVLIFITTLIVSILILSGVLPKEFPARTGFGIAIGLILSSLVIYFV